MPIDHRPLTEVFRQDHAPLPEESSIEMGLHPVGGKSTSQGMRQEHTNASERIYPQQELTASFGPCKGSPWSVRNGSTVNVLNKSVGLTQPIGLTPPGNVQVGFTMTDWNTRFGVTRPSGLTP